MKKNIILGSAISGALMIVSTALFAHNLPAGSPHLDSPDLFGDSLINLPKHGSTVSSSSVDVYFVQIPGAIGYSVDLVGGGVVGGAGGALGAPVCDPSSATAVDRVYEKTQVLGLAGAVDPSVVPDPSKVLCGLETSETKSGDGDVRGLHLCKWTTPNLADGSYAMAINPIMVGGNVISQQEVRTADTCGQAVDLTAGAPPAAGVAGPHPAIDGLATVAVAGNDSFGYVLNTLVGRTVEANGSGLDDGTGVDDVAAANIVAVAGAPVTADTFYQRFAVADATPAPTVMPSMPDGVHPFNGTSLSSNNNLLEFHDPSGIAGAASWYQIWVYDYDGNRVTDYNNDNPTYNSWYKLTVDPALSCTAVTGSTSNRVCTIDLTGEPIITRIAANATANDKMYWYVRGYNSFGKSAWSSYAMFRR